LLCSGKTATFSAPAVIDATSYTWTVTGTGWSGTSTSATFTPTVGTAAATITVTPVNACGTGTPFTITTAAPTITPSSAYALTAHVTDKLVPVTATYTGTAPTGSTYTWSFGGGTATPGTGVGPHSVSWATVGTKTVTLTVDFGGCFLPFSDTVRVKTPVDLKGVTPTPLNFNIVPNPAVGAFDIVFNETINKVVSVTIIDMQGKTVCSSEFDLSNTNRLSIEAVNIASGTYITNVKVGGALMSQKITIMK
jgi:hypothetical protein